MRRVPEPASRSGCATCATARCCVVFDPELTGADVHRLVRGLGLAPADFARLCPVRADQAEGMGVVFDDDCMWELRLLRTALPVGDGGGLRCGFLVSLGPGVSRCGVYTMRPMVCRTFPTDLTVLGVMVGNPPAICPPDAWSQARADLVGLAALHHVAAAERALHVAFVERWNRAPGRHGRPPQADRRGRLAALTSAMLTFWDVVDAHVGAADPLTVPAVVAALGAVETPP